MATDPLSTHTVEAEPTRSSSIIENEFPTYRAISRGAVFAVLFGLASLACFADPWGFLFLPILALITGVLAIRRIRRYPDILTGEKIAQFGITMALIFSLAALTINTVQRFIHTRSASRFAEQYVTVLEKGGLGDMYFYGLPPKARSATTPDKLLEQARAKEADPSRGDMAEMKYGPYKRIMNRIASGNQHVEFVQIENLGMSEDKPFALALFKIHGPTSQEIKEEEQFIGVVLKSQNDGSEDPWWVEDVQFPYKPSSYAPAAKPVDDGHGHAH